MLFIANLLAALFATALVVSAQTTSGTTTVASGTTTVSSGTTTLTSPAPTGTEGINPCILGCATSAASSAGCANVTDFRCLCTSNAFDTAAGQCIQATCPDQASAAQALHSAQCATATGVSASATTTVPSTTTKAASSTTTAAAPGVTKSSAARLDAKGHYGLAGAVIAFVGMLFGINFPL